jgi:hypothetical protein
VVTHFANARPTERSWRRIVLGPLRRVVFGIAPIPDDNIFGVGSLSELQEILGRFRETLRDLSDARAKGGLRLRDVIRDIHDRSGLKVTGQTLDGTSRRLVPRWDTTTQSFEEMIYAYLVLSFYRVRIDALRRCVECDRFFFTLGQRGRYCTGRCQIRAAMRRYRARKRAAATDCAGWSRNA